MRPSALTALTCAALLMLGGCSLLATRPPPPQPVSTLQDQEAAAATRVAATLQLLQRLELGQPAEQAGIVNTARADYQRNPRGEAQLRYALVLAAPGHAASDPNRGQLLLRELVASANELAPVQRALAQVQLSQLDHERNLDSDIARLQNTPPPADSDRVTSLQRRLLAEQEDNGRLRKQLEESQAKLDAIANIERNITERSSGTEARKP